jgi:hypothetical protein
VCGKHAPLLCPAQPSLRPTVAAPQDNNFTGPLPTSMNWLNLHILRLQNNNFGGE